MSIRRVLLMLALCGCGALEKDIGEDEGVPPMSGSTTISIPQDYQCGGPLDDPSGKYTVTSSGDAASCVFTFHQDVTLLEKEDYSSNPALEGARLVKRIDLDVTTFDVVDPSTNARPPNVQNVDGRAFDETILTTADLDRPTPFTVEIEGEPVDALGSQVRAKDDVIMPVDVIVHVGLPAPASLDIRFEAQPNIVLGF
jgi:hypothetical protein